MCPYAAGTVGISKRNFHLGQVSPMPEDVVQGWAERRRPTHRRRGIVGEEPRLPDCVCQKTNRKLSSYDWQKYDILINHPKIQAAEWWWCNFVNFSSISSSSYKWKWSKYFDTAPLNGAKATDNNNIKPVTFGYIESRDLSILTFKNTLDISINVPGEKLLYVMSQCHLRDIRDR